MGNGITIEGSKAVQDNDKMLFPVTTGKKEKQDDKESRLRGNTLYVGDLIKRQEMVSDKFGRHRKGQ